MTALVYLAVYAAILLFMVGTARRIVMYSRTPMHLRWELYPVPHESPAKAAHGGSYFEDADWWTKPRHKNHIGELMVMVPEMLFMKALWEHNRPLWLLSFPFHFGLYLTTAGSLLAAAVVVLPRGASGARSIAAFLVFTGLVGIILGGVALLCRRLFDKKLANYTTVIDLFNVGASATAAGLIIAGHFIGGRGSLARFARGLVRFDTTVELNTLLAAGILLAAAMAAYVPYSHMAHFVAKYFTYHQVRWDDEPNRDQKQMATRIAEYLSYRPSWSARHVGANGERTWAEVATLNPNEMLDAKQEVRK